MSEWRTVKLGDICEVFDGPHATPKKTDSGPIYLGIFNLHRGRLDFSKVAHLSEDDFKRWTRRVEPKKDDIVFSYETRIGEAAIIPEGLRCCLGRRMGLLRPDTTKVNPRFLLYSYLGPEFQYTLKARTIHGSTVDRISIGELPSFPICLPPLPVQRRIAQILGRLDDKIEVNRRINRTLEAMARALYRHWFVDFGPFQDGEFVESELGLIPRGWEVKPLSSVIRLLSGGTPKTKISEYWNGKIPWVAAKDVAAAAPFIMSTERTITALGVEKSSTKILPKFTTIITARGTVGECGLLSREMAMNQTNYGIHGVGALGVFTTYLLIQSVVENLRKHAYGTVFDTITKKTFEGIQVLVPPDAIWHRFEAQITPWFKNMLVNQEQALSLTRTRDYLLPKLLSGEVKIYRSDYATAGLDT